ncbi:MAG: ATP-dependent helicase [Gudongella sp.]|jgi:DNA helicase-2/ATP-dependent DNA helicase PcrA|nr:ATP-dependent helicase [Gudongella sp.]
MEFSKNQTLAIEHGAGPALVLAVPGAGKTTVLIHRTHNLISNKQITPENILSITFSRASAMDMQQRYIKIFGTVNKPEFSTIHAFCYRIIKDFSRERSRSFRLIEEDNSKNNKFNIVKNLYLSHNGYPITEEKLENFFGHAGYIKNMMTDPVEYSRAVSTDVENFLDIFTEYEEIKKRNRLIDFDDMLGIAHRILLKFPDILDKYRIKYQYIQLDEGQDTSKLQLAILKLLASPHNNLFIVADDDQSIYGFRGAYPDELLDFKNVFADGVLYFMEDNYRSTKNIVAVSNKFISQNKNRYSKIIQTQNPPKNPVKILKFRDMTDQYDHIVNALRKEYPISGSAILFRNNLSIVGLANSLKRSGIHFYVRDSRLKFFSHWLVNDVMNFLKLAENPKDETSFEAIYFKMKGYISKKMMLHVNKGDSNLTVFKRLLTYPGLSEFYRKHINELELDFRRLNRMNPQKGIDFIADTLQYSVYLKENSQKSGYTFDYLSEMLYHLKSVARGCRDKDDFASMLKELETSIAGANRTQTGVTLSTIHSAKGLEFDNVFLIDLIEGELPSQSSLEDLSKGIFTTYEEERRIFYVGMTRAKINLELISYATFNGSKLKSSRFLDELQS